MSGSSRLALLVAFLPFWPSLPALPAGEPVPFVRLGDLPEDLRLECLVRGSGLGNVSIHAHGEQLLGRPAVSAPGPSGDGPEVQVRIDGRGPDDWFAGTLDVVDRREGPGWEYLVVNVTPAYGTRLARFHRHLLFVAPDLFVVYDEVSAKKPVALAVRWSSPGDMRFEETARLLRLERERAGLTGRWLPASAKVFGEWEKSAGGVAAGLGLEPWSCLETHSSEPVAEVRFLTVWVPHATGRKRALGFKLLETSTAIGVRVHRDGYPTLIAFRTDPAAAEADLTGLKFQGPVAVDVFQPKKRR